MAPLLELHGVTKWFGPTAALRDVSFSVDAGQVHVVAGENGAGKSTLIRILSGAITNFDGEFLFRGQPARFKNAQSALTAGIATIHQELSLVGSLTVSENLGLPRQTSLFSWVRRNADIAHAKNILASVGLDVDPTCLVETLPLATRQLLEIGRALSANATLLILDEPTSALSETEADRLLLQLERLAQGGTAIVYISHRMTENERIGHMVTVLRDGRVVASRATLDNRTSAAEDAAPSSTPHVYTSTAKLSERSTDPPPTPDREDLLNVTELHLNVEGVSPLRGVSFSVRPGEILGLAGLRGAGTSETLAALFGVFGSAVRGEVRLQKKPFSIKSPEHSIQRGLAFLANDRKKTVLADLTVQENITLSGIAGKTPRSAEWVGPMGYLRLAAEARFASRFLEELRVVPRSPALAANALSGGNQQKVALGRCLATDPLVLLLDEPTRGVDVSAKADIHAALRTYAAEGKGIVVAASELGELLGLCDRIAILSRGRVTSEVQRENFSYERVRLALDRAAP